MTAMMTAMMKVMMTTTSMMMLSANTSCQRGEWPTIRPGVQGSPSRAWGFSPESKYSCCRLSLRSKYSWRVPQGVKIFWQGPSWVKYSCRVSPRSRILTVKFPPAVKVQFHLNTCYPINIPPPQTIGVGRRDPTFSVQKFTFLTNSFRFADIYVLLASAAGVTAEDKSLSPGSRPESSPLNFPIQ